MKTIVVSAVNIRKGGTLTVLRECLKALSHIAKGNDAYHIVALVHNRGLCEYENVEYLEFPLTVKSWFRRLWCEYVTMRKVSESIGKVDLWLSLHDTTPNVHADRQAVYCQTSFPFLRPKLQDLWFDYKIVLFSLFTRFAYRINVHSNDYLIVQAEWLRTSLSKLLGVPQDKFIVFPPRKVAGTRRDAALPEVCRKFIYAASADCHKNFETLFRAVELIEQDRPDLDFELNVTVSGSENRYSKWLYNHWSHLKSVHFIGQLPREELFREYSSSDCLVFPSRIETWGLPISEFGELNKPMILADLPYSAEAAAGCDYVTFFQYDDPIALKDVMIKLITGNYECLGPVKTKEIDGNLVDSWEALFSVLLNYSK
ncbi:MAG: glycosyltransferase family 1 protein [Bacteroidales bacterium]|nr:glycosyltransferase family 1 protein [Bacteroidales bacterium]